jgi:tetrahydromethanopterin S-methyltransferase subunit C
MDVLDYCRCCGYVRRVLALGVGMRGIGLVLVGLGLTVMLAGLAYNGVGEWHPNVAAAVWAFLGGTLLAVTGSLLHTRG